MTSPAKKTAAPLTRGELLTRLLAEHRNPSVFQRLAEDLIADERQRGNRILAGSLKRALEAASVAAPSNERRFPTGMNALPLDRDKRVALTEVVEARRSRNDVILSSSNSALLGGVLDELRRADTLRRHGLRPTSKLLFCGPPGCGKTTCAEAFANEAGLPLVVTRIDVLVSSFLGETSTNLRRIFEFVHSTPSVLLLDEFDTVARTRDDDNEHGELKRVVNSLLQLIDRHQGPGVIIAATNHESKLDAAIWRRFDQVVYFDQPSVREIKSLLRLNLKNFPLDFDASNYAESMEGMSHAEVERISIGAIKIAVLSGEKRLSEDAFKKALAAERRRKRTIQKMQAG